MKYVELVVKRFNASSTHAALFLGVHCSVRGQGYAITKIPYNTAHQAYFLVLACWFP